VIDTGRSGDVHDAPLTILQVSMNERRGGAEQIAWNLFRAYRAAGHRSYLLAGRGRSTDPDVIALSENGRRGLAHTIAGIGRRLDQRRGLETYRYPASRGAPELAPRRPDIIHAHNLHGGYFDLRALAEWSDVYPVVLTLHDSWLLTGHCSHSLGCERWRIGCGACPDLTIYPAVRRDATARNWERKRDVFAASRLFVATPSAWLMERVKASMLVPGVRDSRVIPNGVDLGVFAPGDRRASRAALGLPADAHVLLFAGSNARASRFKDFDGAKAATTYAAERVKADVVLVVLGDEGETERAGAASVRFVPFRDDPSKVAAYYQAADIYLHAARVDTFPTTVLEALACGTPVVASAVGGIPEQVRSLTTYGEGPSRFAPTESTGVLAAPGDAESLGRAVADLLADEALRVQLGRNAAADARRRFSLEGMRDAYLTWYRELLSNGANGVRLD
jgi:glycosyltransferase involved in cell wall biosynthesis